MTTFINSVPEEMFDSIVDDEDLGISDFCSRKIKNRFIFKNFIEHGQVYMLAGAPKTGKTLLLMELANAAARKMDFLGFKCMERAKVLYIDLELSKDIFANRIRVISGGFRSKSYNQHFRVLNESGKNVSINGIYDFLKDRKSHGKVYDLIIIDCLYKCLPGSEIDPETAAAFGKTVNRIKLLNDSAVVVCHHFAKDSGSRDGIDRFSGSSVFARQVDGLMMLNVSRKTRKITLDCVMRNVDEINLDLDFHYPFHSVIESEENGENVPAQHAHQKSNRAFTNAKFDECFAELQKNGADVTFATLSLRLGVSPKTIDRHVKSRPSEYSVNKSVVTKY